MTNDELNIKAEKSYWDNDCASGAISNKDLYKLGYITGVKENGVFWHDLRKDPNDLPPKYTEEEKNFPVSIMVINQNGDDCFYDYEEKSWFCYDAEDIIAWMEKPCFKEA